MRLVIMNIANSKKNLIWFTIIIRLLNILITNYKLIYLWFEVSCIEVVFHIFLQIFLKISTIGCNSYKSNMINKFQEMKFSLFFKKAKSLKK